MKIRIGLALLGICLLSAQTPDFSGVWKVNPEKSKMPGQPNAQGAPPTILMIIEQKDGKLSVTNGQFGARGEQRWSLAYNMGDKPSINSFRGQAMKTETSMDGGSMLLKSQVAGSRPSTLTEKYTLSPDGQTLTIDSKTMANGKETASLMVLDKQPESAGDPLRKPEQIAGERFKNVQLLKDLPASQFLDAMRSFDTALGVECEHCHVQGDFASDDKGSKKFARKMITMTHAANESAFGGKMVVRCYTCHQGKPEPQSMPRFN